MRQRDEVRALDEMVHGVGPPHPLEVVIEPRRIQLVERCEARSLWIDRQHVTAVRHEIRHAQSGVTRRSFGIRELREAALIRRNSTGDTSVNPVRSGSRVNR
jgi:hypothetical protein